MSQNECLEWGLKHHEAHGPSFIYAKTICCTPYLDILEQFVFPQQLDDHDFATF
jgi:hypothetical protein